MRRGECETRHGILLRHERERTRNCLAGSSLALLREAAELGVCPGIRRSVGGHTFAGGADAARPVRLPSVNNGGPALPRARSVIGS